MPDILEDFDIFRPWHETAYSLNSFIFKTQNCSLFQAHNIPFVKLTEGKMVKAMAPTATNIEELTVKMEVLRPEI